MKRVLQRAILLGFRLAQWSGVLSTKAGMKSERAAYDLYKTLFDPSVRHLSQYVLRDTFVVDVGANVGFFTNEFAGWVSGSGKVLAVEPEAKNIAALLNRFPPGYGHHVEVIPAAAADIEGRMFLAVSTHSPADHRLATTGVPIAATTIDKLMGDRGWPHVSLIKIDVQGAEFRVISGARETILRFRPVIMLEIDDTALISAGSSADSVLETLTELGYRPFDVRDHRFANPLTKASAGHIRLKLGYADYVFLPRPA